MPPAGSKGRSTDFPAVQQARMTSGSTLTLTGSAQDVAGATLTVTVGGADAVALVSATFDFAQTACTAATTEVGQLVVDGVAQDGQALLAQADVNSQRATVAQSWLIPLAAGTHTLKLQAFRIGGTGTFVCYGTHTQMTALILNPGA